MAQNSEHSGGGGGSQHAAQDSVLSVRSTAEDAAQIKELESEVRSLAEKAAAACMLVESSFPVRLAALSPNVAGQGKLAIR